jgi:hypothetical protein
MISKEFVGKVQAVNTTSNGGKVTVAFGNIITTDDEKLEAIAIQILDHLGGTVAEFALQPETFGVLIETIKELYDDTI